MENLIFGCIVIMTICVFVLCVNFISNIDDIVKYLKRSTDHLETIDRNVEIDLEDIKARLIVVKENRELFNYMRYHHDLNLTESELQEIERIANDYQQTK